MQVGNFAEFEYWFAIGYYLHPEVFGQPNSKSIQAASQKASADQLAKVSNP
jgi:hypothetical protein